MKTAEYDGTCPECMDEIVGDYDTIVYSPEHGAFVHEECG